MGHGPERVGSAIGKPFAQSIDEGALMKACYENASRTMFDSEPQSSKITQVAKKSFFEIAKQDAWVRCPRLETTRSSWPLYRALQIIVTVPFRSCSISCSVILARGCRA
jgi:hypothetical protein